MNQDQPEFDYSVVMELKLKASKKNPKLVTFTVVSKDKTGTKGHGRLRLWGQEEGAISSSQED